jgi:uncharacterized protein YukE
VGSLTPSDVKRWDPNAIHTVFETASGRADTLQRLGDSLQQAHDVLADWQGEGGDAFRADAGKIRRDIEADGAESKRVAAAVSRAEMDVNACKQELDGIRQAVEYNGWTITPDWRIDAGNNAVGRDPIKAAALQKLQGDLSACKVHAHNADHELATAIGAAVGEVPLDAVGSAPGAAPPAQGPPNPAPGGEPRTLQDMLLPDGPADGAPGGVPPKGPPVPAGEPGSAAPKGPPVPAGGGGKPKTWQDMLLPAGPADAGPGGPAPKGPPAPAGAGGKPKTWQDMLLPAGAAPPPRLNPADVESFKAMARQSMISGNVPPDQIEGRLNDAVSAAQHWIDNGMPNYVPPEPHSAPAPGFGEGFGDRWFATERGIHNLLGVGGPGAPGVAESWAKMLMGTVETAANPPGALIGEAKNALDSPSSAYFLGGKAADAAVTLPTLLFGGEGAGLGKLADVDAAAIDYGPTHLPHVPTGFDQPMNYHAWADSAGQDLYAAFTHGEPTADLSRQLAEMSTHYRGDNPDRVVLGKFDGPEAGYMGNARGNGGIYFDTGNPTWDAMTDGLSKPVGNDLAWEVNQQFLRGQMENGVSRIEYQLPPGFSSVEELAALDPRSFSAREIAFLKSNAEAYGYQQVGDAWVRVTGGR